MAAAIGPAPAATNNQNGADKRWSWVYGSEDDLDLDQDSRQRALSELEERMTKTTGTFSWPDPRTPTGRSSSGGGYRRESLTELLQQDWPRVSLHQRHAAEGRGERDVSDHQSNRGQYYNTTAYYHDEHSSDEQDNDGDSRPYDRRYSRAGDYYTGEYRHGDEDEIDDDEIFGDDVTSIATTTVTMASSLMRNPTALHRAAYEGNTRNVKYLTKPRHGSSKSSSGKNGTGKGGGAKSGSGKISSNHINDPDPHGDTPLMIAAACNFRKIVKILLRRGADKNVKHETSGYTALLVAVRKRHVDIVKLLVLAGADINAGDQQKRRPLHWTAANNRPDIAKMLLKHGAKVDGTDRYGNTPLMLACAAGSQDCVRLFLSMGANALARSQDGSGTLHHAAAHGNSTLLQAVLVSAGKLNQRALVNSANNSGDTPLMVAVERGNMAATVYLMSVGADIEHADMSGNRPLHLACACHPDPDLARLLLAHNADPNATNTAGSTPLHHAAFRGHALTAAILLRYGSRSAPNCRGDSPLGVAAQEGHAVTAAAILDSCRPLAVSDVRRAWTTARDKGQRQVAAMLFRALPPADRMRRASASPSTYSDTRTRGRQDIDYHQRTSMDDQWMRRGRSGTLTRMPVYQNSGTSPHMYGGSMGNLNRGPALEINRDDDMLITRSMGNLETSTDMQVYRGPSGTLTREPPSANSRTSSSSAGENSGASSGRKLLRGGGPAGRSRRGADGVTHF